MATEVIYSAALVVERVSDEGEQGPEEVYVLHEDHGWSDDELHELELEFEGTVGAWVPAVCLSEEGGMVLGQVLDDQEFKGISVMYIDACWCGRVTRDEEQGPWIFASTEMELLRRLSEEFRAERDPSAPDFLSSCPRCGAPSHEAKLEHGIVRARVWAQRFDLNKPHDVQLDEQSQFYEHTLSCASCGAQDISLSELKIP